MNLGDIKFTCSGKNNGLQKQGVRFMINKKGAKSCLGCKDVNNRMPVTLL